jgi:hypothetical protein
MTVKRKHVPYLGFPVREKTSVEDTSGLMGFPVREIMLVETYTSKRWIARRALTERRTGDVDVLTDNCRTSGSFSTDVVSLTGNLIKPNISSTNIKSLTGNPIKPNVSSTNIKSLTWIFMKKGIFMAVQMWIFMKKGIFMKIQYVYFYEKGYFHGNTVCVLP